MATSQTIDTPRETRRAVASYPDYAVAERAVDWLSDQGFAVERTAIVGRSLRSVALLGALAHMGKSGGQRDFVSATSIVADRYEVQVDDGIADEAQRLLGAMPGGR